MSRANALSQAVWQSFFTHKFRKILDQQINENIEKKFVKTLEENEDWVIKEEVWNLEGEDPSRAVKMVSAYSKVDGSYIGEAKFAKHLKKKKLKKIQKAEPDHSTASIALNDSEQKWYGWSHRAICGFGVGDKLFDEKWKGNLSEEELEKTPFVQRGEKTIRTMADAKRAAANFARYVS